MYTTLNKAWKILENIYDKSRIGEIFYEKSKIEKYLFILENDQNIYLKMFCSIKYFWLPWLFLNVGNISKIVTHLMTFSFTNKLDVSI